MFAFCDKHSCHVAVTIDVFSFFYHKKNNFDLIPICITTRSKHSTQVQVVFFLLWNYVFMSNKARLKMKKKTVKQSRTSRQSNSSFVVVFFFTKKPTSFTVFSNDKYAGKFF